MTDYIVVPDGLTGGGLATPAGIQVQYVMVVDGRPDPIVVSHQVGPTGGLIIVNQGRRGPAGQSAYELAVAHGFSGTLQQYLQMQRGFILLPPDVDTPPTGTYDETWVFQEVDA